MFVESTIFKRISISCLIIILHSAVLFAQAYSAVPNQVSVFLDVRMASSADNATYNSVLAKNATIELKNRGYSAVPGGELSRVLPDADLAEEGVPSAGVVNGMAAQAREQMSKYICLIRYIKRDELVHFTVYFWRIDGGLLVSYKTKDVVGLAVYNRMNKAVALFVGKVGEGKTVIIADDQKGGPKQYVKEIIVYSPNEGCEIWLKDSGKLGVVKDGKLVLPYMPLTVGSTILIEKKKQGYYSAVEEVKLAGIKNEINLMPLERIFGSGLFFTWTTGQFVGLGVGYMDTIDERYVYWGVENYFFLQVNDTQDMNPVIHDDIRGFILNKFRFAEGFPLTISFSSGLGMIFSLLTIEDSPIYLDLYLNPLNFHIEYAMSDYVLFLRAEYKIALGLGRNLLGSGLIVFEEGVPLFTLGVITQW
jgi:hypothetical protein